MSTEQKKNHIGYLLQILRKDGKIYVGDKKYWMLT
jgi:hypothetical protein